MAAVDRGRKQKSILLIGVFGAAVALLLLVWLLGERSLRPTISEESESRDEGSSASAPIASSPVTEPIASDVRSAHDGAPDVRAHRSEAALDGGRAAILSGPVAGRVVDARTKEPVPYVDVRLASGVIDEVVSTGRDGTFQSTREFKGDKLTAVITDSGRAVQTLVRDPASPPDEPWILAVDIGPTYPLVIDAGSPIVPAQWTARVVETTRNLANAGEIDVDERGLHAFAPANDAEDREWPWLPLRGEPMFAADVAWIRYPSILFEADPRHRLRAQVRCESLGRKGMGRVHGTIGVQEPVIVDGLQQFGALAGKIVDADGVAVGGATVLLLPPRAVGASDHTPQWESAQSNEKGEFRFVDATPGRRTLVAFAPREAVLELPKFVVTPGAVMLEEALRLPKTSRHGELDAAPGPAPAASAKQAAPRDPRRRGRESVYAHVRLPQAGRYARDWVQAFLDLSLMQSDAHLEAARLPSAPLEIQWIDLLESRIRERPPVAPPLMELPDPSAKLGVRYGGRGFGQELRFEIEGEPSSTTSFDVSFEPGGVLVGEQNAGELRRWTLARGAPVRWVVWRRGFAPMFGTQSTLAEGKTRELTARIQSRAGWGAVLWCRTSDGSSPLATGALQGLGYAGDDSPRIPPLHEVLAAPPLPGVRVLVDGTLEDTSDAEGVVRLARGTLPARLVLFADGWHMVRLERLPQRSAATLRYVVWMKRD